MMLNHEGLKAMGDAPDGGVGIKSFSTSASRHPHRLVVFRSNSISAYRNSVRLFQPMLIAAAASIRSRRGAHHAGKRRRPSSGADRDRAARLVRSSWVDLRCTDQLVRALSRTAIVVATARATPLSKRPSSLGSSAGLASPPRTVAGVVWIGRSTTIVADQHLAEAWPWVPSHPHRCVRRLFGMV